MKQSIELSYERDGELFMWVHRSRNKWHCTVMGDRLKELAHADAFDSFEAIREAVVKIAPKETVN